MADAAEETPTEDPALTTEFDVVVLGTGLTECIMSGFMSTDKKKVLHMDRNDFYGGAAASLTLDQLFRKFDAGEADDSMGNKRDFNIDLIPKFVLAKGLLVDILLHTRTQHYIDFAKVDGSYVMAKGYVNKVPATPKEALSSNLMGMFEKRRMKKVLDYVGEYDPADPATHKGKDCTKLTTAELFAEASLDESTVTFMGHAIALWTDDAYLTQPAEPTCLKMKQYAESLMMYGGSPFIYPLYGLGDLPQAFARLSAVHGGTFMLDTPFNGIVTDDDGELCGVKSVVEGKECILKCKAIFASPDYFPEKVDQVGEVVRTYCIINQPVKPDGKTVVESGQIIIPGREAGKKNDIYVMWMGKTLQVATPGHYIALVSTVKENADPAADVAAGLKLLPPALKQFTSVDPICVPKTDGKEEQIFISKSYDPTSHFESCCLDCLDLYKRYAGADLVLTKPEPDPEA